MAIPWPPFITRVINPHRELDSLDNVSQRVINEIITPILCELLTAMKERGDKGEMKSYPDWSVLSPRYQMKGIKPW